MSNRCNPANLACQYPFSHLIPRVSNFPSFAKRENATVRRAAPRTIIGLVGCNCLCLPQVHLLVRTVFAAHTRSFYICTKLYMVATLGFSPPTVFCIVASPSHFLFSPS